MNNVKIYTVDDIKKSLEPVFRKNGVKSAILFGSYAKGMADEKSDVDILVDSGLRGLNFFGLIEYVREALDDKQVDLIDITEIKKGTHIENEIYETGINIYGKNEKFKDYKKTGRVYMENKNIVDIKKIIEHIDKIKNYVGDAKPSEFIENNILIELCAFNLLQIGEYANNIRDDFKAAYSNIPIPWDKIRGMRNRLVHAYESMDVNFISKTVYNDLDIFKEQLNEILNI